ncbi:hypothetical protein D3C81_1698470 [compost metagenome]
MVTEAMRADDRDAAALASSLAAEGCEAIRAYVAAHAPADKVETITDYVILTLRGLSSYACLGHPQQKLVSCSKLAGIAFQSEFTLS